MRVEDNAGPRIDVVRRESQHRTTRSGVASQPCDDKMGHCVEDFEDQVVDRVNVPPRSPAGSALASIALRWIPLDQKSAPPSSTMTLVGRARAWRNASRSR